jgi:hypothetical protein
MSWNKGSFYASAFENQSVLALTFNDDNSLLIAGDTLGYIYIWNIDQSKPIPNNENAKFVKPVLLNTWRVHDTAVMCCQYIKETDSSITSNELIVTASTDWACRVWTLDGAYVGAFGQELKWNLNDLNTFQSLVNFNDAGETVRRLARPKSITEVSGL